MICSKCGALLNDLYLCLNEVCGYRPGGPESTKPIKGRYRHPLLEDGTPCLCNRGHRFKFEETNEQRDTRFLRQKREAEERSVRAAEARQRRGQPNL